MKVEKKVTGKEDLVVEVSNAELTELLSNTVCELMGNIKDVGDKDSHSTVFISLTLFSAMLLNKLFKEDEEEK